jgi:hypothetical protein
MDALIEAWWSPAEFGIVCLMTRPGTIVVDYGCPIAQMNVFLGEAATAQLEVLDEPHPERAAWRQRRYRVGYSRDLDYLKGLHPDGRETEAHFASWRSYRARQ